MKPPKSEKIPEPTAQVSSNDDILNTLAALEEEERAAVQRAAARRAAAFADLIADLNTRAAKMTSAGFEFAAIGKAMGFLPAKGGTATPPTNKPSGPTTHIGWFNLFRSRSIQTYLRTHSDLAARFKADSIKSSDYPNHIPPTDLEAIDLEARASAEQRCPSIPSAS